MGKVIFRDKVQIIEIIGHFDDWLCGYLTSFKDIFLIFDCDSEGFAVNVKDGKEIKETIGVIHIREKSTYTTVKKILKYAIKKGEEYEGEKYE